MATGTVVEVARAVWGVGLPRPRTARFGESGWTYDEEVAHPCPVCGTSLKVLRKPYVTANGRRQRYVALVCLACPASYTLQDLGLRAARELHRGTRQIPSPGNQGDIVELPELSTPDPVGQEADGEEGARRSRVLRFWRAVELFSAQEVDPAAPKERRYDIAPAELLPWDGGHRLHGTKKQRKDNVWRYTVYGGIYGLDELFGVLSQVFGESGLDVDERTPRGQSALFAVEVSPDGRLLLDSLTLSEAAWAVGRTINPGPHDPEWLDGFEQCARQFTAAVEEAAQAHEDDKDALELAANGISVSRKVDMRLLRRLVRLAEETLGVGGYLRPEGLRVQCIEVSPRRAYEPEADFLNSFLADDLERVAAMRAGTGQALTSYLMEQSDTPRLDVRDVANIDTVLDMLAPAHVPAGRWPTNPEHALATSQQLAVNQILGGPTGTAGLFGVNGPPGTGKTTMLRDLIAAQVVERARRLADLKSPAAAFTPNRLRWRTGEKEIKFPRLVEHLTGFEMVVASSNNGAVQNVTRELPDRDKAIDAPWKGTDYLAEHATRLLLRTDDDGTEDGPDAWGLVAATLGNRGNRSRFVDRLWFTREPDGEGKPGWVGLQDWLKEQHAQADPTLWETAVKGFQKALDTEATIRRQRQEVHDIALALPRLEADRANAAERIDRASEERNQAAKAVVRAEQEHEESIKEANRVRERRSAHCAHKPRWYEMIWTLGSSLRRWNAEDEPIAERQRAAESAEDETAARLRTAKAALSGAQEQVDDAREALAEAGRRLAMSLARIDHVRSSMTGDHAAEHVPDSAWRETERRRETYAPWLDVTWNEARTEVFLSALDLHRAFLIGAGWRMRLLLGAAMDAVNGNVPDDAPTEELHAAWQGLFLLVPVVSTTFASVGRMLERVGPEAFGWLLIDEAGQATPQAAVGAIWRARRVVAVGDPLQLEPVLTTLHSAQAQLRDHHGVSDIWLPDQLSVQVLADRVTQVGTTVQRDEEDLWVGAPLRVHRRCDEPMFSVVNDAVYHGLMIHGDPGRRDALGVPEDGEPEPEPLVLDRPVPRSYWADVRTGEVDGKWIPAEGEATVEILRDLVKRHGISPADILVLTPFRAVAKRLKDLAGERIPGGQKIVCGTVHVSQGKQAPVVVLVLAGTTPGARSWAAERPNLLNVAVSRAEHRLYVVGSQENWADKRYFSTLAGRLPARRYPDGTGDRV